MKSVIVLSVMLFLVGCGGAESGGANGCADGACGGAMGGPAVEETGEQASAVEGEDPTYSWANVSAVVVNVTSQPTHCHVNIQTLDALGRHTLGTYLYDFLGPFEFRILEDVAGGTAPVIVEVEAGCGPTGDTDGRYYARIKREIASDGWFNFIYNEADPEAPIIPEG